MKKYFSKKNSIIAAVVAIFIIAGGIYWYISSSTAPNFATAEVTRGNVVESVSEPATIAAEHNASLSFEESGQIAHVYVQEGQAVSAGQALIDLDQSSLAAAALEASSAVAVAQAKLDELQMGTRPEQLAIDQSAVSSAQATVGSDVALAYNAAADAVQNRTDNLFSNPRTINPTFLPNTNDPQAVSDIQTSRVAVGIALSTWYSGITASSTNPASLVLTANTALKKIEDYLNTVALAVNGAIPDGSMSAATLATYKADVVTARTETAAAHATLTNAESALTAAEQQLALAQAGSTPQDIEAQQAAVSQAQAAAYAAQVALGNATLRAPFSGTVQGLTAQVGQVVAPGAILLSLVNNQGLKIQAYVSDADVGKIKTGDAADVTLDAYGTSVVFPATVTTVATLASKVNGSTAYQVILHFTKSDARLKDGMTGNVSIVGAEHDNVLEVPSRLVISDDGENFVLVKQGSASVKQQVQTGIVGARGMTEIVSGLNEGDQLINF